MGEIFNYKFHTQRKIFLKHKAREVCRRAMVSALLHLLAYFS